jgi:hypothetical protein
MSGQLQVDPPSVAMIWRRVIDNASLESARSIFSQVGSQLAGTILASHEGQPLEIRYRVRCDSEWRTREVSVRQRLGFVDSNLELFVDDAGAWRSGGGILPALAGCTDVDIEFTPATNALPVNRLKLPVDGSAEVLVAWIRIPSLAIMPAKQQYQRLQDNVYRYTSLQSGFTADLEVDKNGLPIRYGSIWERIAFATVNARGADRNSFGTS